MKEPIKDGGNAFPRGVDSYGCVNDGMTLRDWFAGQALTGIQTQWFYIQEYLESTGDGTANHVREFMAWASYEQADKMLAERKEAQ